MERFSFEANGYNRYEVDKYINLLEEELAKYKDLEESLKTAIIRNEVNANEIKRGARKEADEIIKEARSNASKLINDALVRVQKTESQRELLETNIRIFKKRLNVLIKEEQVILEEINKLDITDN